MRFKRLTAVVGILTASILVGLTPHFEGGPFFLPYKDPVGIWTVCLGHTGKDVIPGKRYTLQQCEDFFDEDMTRHANNVLKCSPKLKEHPYFLATATDFDFNTGMWCKSQASVYFNKGDLKTACKLTNENFNGNPQWVSATDKNGNKIQLPGLVKRRAAFREVCSKEFE